MGNGKIGGKIVLDGESQYRSALSGIKTEHAQLRSEMKLCMTTFRDSQNSLEALRKKHEIVTKQVDAQTRIMEICKKAVADYSAKQKEAAGKISELQTALDKAEVEMREMSESSDKNSDAMKAQAELIGKLRTELGNAEQNYDTAGKKVLEYQTSLNHAEAALKEMQEEQEKVGGYVREAEESIDGCAGSIDEYGKEVKESSEQTDIFGEVLKANLLSESIIAGVKALADGIKSIAQSAMESGISFESSMSQVAATMGMTADEVRNGSREYMLLSDAAKECGKATMFSASESADALNYLALAGYDAEKAAATLPKVLDLAAAGGLDLAYASDLVTDSMGALGLETSQLDNYIDEMARTSQKSNTSVAQLGEATLVCAGAVSLTGQSLETMNASLGVLANNGIKGAEGGTHLRNILQSLAAPTDTAAEAISELGLQTSDSQGDMRNLADIITDLNEKLGEMSSTQKTQMISRIFNSTDITAVNALLKGMGEEYENLYTEISNCSGAAADMAKTLNDNLKGKVTILQSALEGLGISAYEIFDDEMKKSVESATDAVGRLQESMDNGELGVSMRKFSQSLGELVEGAVEFGEDALPVVIDGLTWVMDNADLIISGIAGIAAANMQMKIVSSPAIEMATMAWKDYKKINESATISQWLLNTAMKANPAGILITAITGLTAAVAAYVFINRDNFKTTDETTRATKELVEASKELNSSYAAAKEDRVAAREGMEFEAENCKNLVAELKELQEKTSLTASEQARQRMIIDELNLAMPDLNLAIDEQTGRLNMSTQALENNVDAMMESAKAEAARKDMYEIAEQMYEAEKKLYELEKQKIEQDEKVRESEDGKISVYHQARKAQMELEEQITETKEAIAGLGDEYQNTLDYLQEGLEGWGTVSAGILGLKTATLATSDGFKDMSATVQEKLAEMQTSLEKTVRDQLTLFTKFNGEMEMSTSELLDNMQSQVDGIEQWSENLALLAERGINQGLLKSLEEMGPAGAGYVATFVEMTDEELQKANELFAESLSLPTEVAESAVESYQLAGTMAAEGFKGGMEEAAEEVAATGEMIAKSVLDQMNQTLDTHSPSKETQKIGEYVDEGLILGIKSRKPEVLNIVTRLCTEVVGIARRELAVTTFKDIGAQIPAGLETGIRAGKSGVISAVTELCMEAVRTAKSTLQINSPSKKFEYMGRMSGEGYISGWKSTMKHVNAVIASSLPEASYDRAQVYKGMEHGIVDVSDYPVKQIDVHQEIKIYSPADDLVEMSRKFKQTQKEAAREW